VKVGDAHQHRPVVAGHRPWHPRGQEGNHASSVDVRLARVTIQYSWF